MDIRLIDSQLRYNKNQTIRKRWWFIKSAFLSGNVARFCAREGIKRSYYYFWFKRFRESGWNIDSLLDRSRRPLTSPQLTDAMTTGMIVKERKKTGRGASAIGATLRRAASTVGKVLKREGLIGLKKSRAKRAKHTRRYELETPGQIVQVDVKYVPKASGPRHYQFTAIDDCTRWRFVGVYKDKSVASTKDFVERLMKAAPFAILCIQTDHGSEFTNRMFESLCTKKERPREHVLDRICRENGIRHKLIPVGQCEVNGKVERSHRVDDDEFYSRTKWRSFEQLRRKVARWVRRYNEVRLHGSLGWKTPKQYLTEKLNAINTSV